MNKNRRIGLNYTLSWHNEDEKILESLILLGFKLFFSYLFYYFVTNPG